MKFNLALDAQLKHVKSALDGEFRTLEFQS